VHQGFVSGYAESIQTVFLIAVPIAVLGFLASWLIPQVELKQWAAPAAAAPTAEGQAAAVDAASSLDDIQATNHANGTGVPSETLDPQDAGRADGGWGPGAGRS
jgi:FlaG/FlaF family flagellin (archaellin)